jgi:hypothetical protein
LGERKRRERQRTDGGATRQREPSAASVDQSAGCRCGESRHEETHGERAEDRDVADAEFVANGTPENGDRVVETAPGDDLRDAEHGHHPAKPQRLARGPGFGHLGGGRMGRTHRTAAAMLCRAKSLPYLRDIGAVLESVRCVDSSR